MLQEIKNAWKSIRDGDKNLKKEHKEHKNNEGKVGWHIYNTEGKPEKVKDLSKRLYDIHHRLKAQFLRPLIFIAEYYNKKYYRGVPDTIYNTNLKIFEKAFDKSNEEWHKDSLS